MLASKLRLIPRTVQLTKPFIRGFGIENIVYEWDKVPRQEGVPKKVQWDPHTSSKKAKELKTQKDIEEFRKKMIEKAQQKVRGETEAEAEVEEDELFPEAAPIRKYNTITAKELYWQPRSDDHYEAVVNRISFLKEFLPPYVIPDQTIVNLIKEIAESAKDKLKKDVRAIQDPTFNPSEWYKTRPDLVKKFEALTEKLRGAHYRLLPNIALSVAFDLRYKEDTLGFWAVFEEELSKALHQFSLVEYVKLKWALSGTLPQACSIKLNRALFDLTIEEMNKGVNAEEWMYIYQAFRNISRDKIHTKLFNVLVEKKNVLLPQDPNKLASLMYTFANCRLPKNRRPVYREVDLINKEARTVLDTYLEELNKAIPQMNLDSLTRMAIVLNLLRQNNYQDLVYKLEKAIIKNKNELKKWQLTDILYNFSKMENGAPGGSEKLYKELEPIVWKFAKDFTTYEMSRVLFALAARGVCTDKMKNELVLPWVKENIKSFNYAELHNVGTTLMYLSVEDKDIWAEFIRNVSHQEFRCPVIHYFALKEVKYYCQALWPHWNFGPFDDTCLHAERNFNTLRLWDSYLKIQEFHEFKALLQKTYNINATQCYNFDNLYLLDFALLSNKIVIQLQTQRESLPNSTAARPAYLLKLKNLERHGWTVISINWQEFKEMGPARDEWFTQTFAKVWAKKAKTPAQEEWEKTQKTIDSMVAMDRMLTPPQKLMEQLKAIEDEMESQQPGELDKMREELDKYIEDIKSGKVQKISDEGDFISQYLDLRQAANPAPPKAVEGEAKKPAAEDQAKKPKAAAK